MKSWVILIVSLSWLQGSLHGQDATAILDRLSERYTTATGIDISFDLIVTYPEEAPVTLASRVRQVGDRFAFTNHRYEYYYDGSDIWVYVAEQNEVQINDYDPDEAGDYFVSPLDLLKKYKSGAYTYQAVPSPKGETHIEFKPEDEFDDYAKFRLELINGAKDIKSIVAIGKDGSNNQINIHKISWDQEISPKELLFDKSKHPNCRIEDLRLD